ncbi:MAG: asparagine synthase (glutamine-hydrolyzing) [Polynucleobacter sp.]|nr:asparagine synthase (glutamine-hydrolyzing) [Polynucleobacter sp.]
MCGIIGVISSTAINNRGWLQRGRDSLISRGPDDLGEWWSSDGLVGLAHRRLSILDLSNGGHQPMQNSSGSLSIVFNGEIYNHHQIRSELESNGFVFKSNSDTEVLMSAYKYWGNDCVNHLNGMFSFAIYDEPNKIMFMARDRAGEKPFFYYLNGNELRFASELKAILEDNAIPRKLNDEALDCYLWLGYVPGGLCIFEGFNKLPPAHAMEFNARTGKCKIWRYWSLPDPIVNSKQSFNEDTLLEELEYLLADAVRMQMVADVPVGVLLSGGVDSSLITAFAARSSNQVKTFTIGFPGHGSLDETLHARLIANHFGTVHTELEAQPFTADLLPKLAYQFDEPIIDSSMIPTYLVTKLVREQCTVALGGDGGDELFGGYGHYSRLLKMESSVGDIPLAIRRIVANLAGYTLPVGFKGRNWLQGLGVDLKNGVPLIASYFDLATRERLLVNGASPYLKAEKILGNSVANSSNLLERATRMDFQNYLAEDILVKVDRASMLNSLEMRAPFLDYRLINFAFEKVPPALKATAVDKKIILKRLTTKLLPPEFDRQRKQGFSIPLAAWLKKGPFRDLFYETLLHPDCIFNRKVVIDLLSNQDRGYANSERLFALVMFELWRKAYHVSF